MNIVNRSYPYPVLTEDTDDYTSSVFDIDFSYKMSTTDKLNLKLNINMDNEGIQELIDADKMEYLLHIECGITSYRVSIPFRSKTMDYEISLGDINKKLELIVLLVAKEEIKGYKNEKLNKVYEGLTFHFTKGNIVGYKNLQPININKDYEELLSADTIFSVYRIESETSTAMRINMESDRLKVGLANPEFRFYIKYCKNIIMQPILNSMIILPALTQVFTELRYGYDLEVYMGYSWFISLVNAYERVGLNFLEELEDESKPVLQIAQEAMGLPFKAGFESLEELCVGGL